MLLISYRHFHIFLVLFSNTRNGWENSGRTKYQLCGTARPTMVIPGSIFLYASRAADNHRNSKDQAAETNRNRGPCCVGMGVHLVPARCLWANHLRAICSGRETNLKVTPMIFYHSNPGALWLHQKDHMQLLWGTSTTQVLLQSWRRAAGCVLGATAEVNAGSPSPQYF